MAKSVSDIAQLCSDAFYQNFRSDEDFFRLEHFEQYAILADAKLKNDEFREQVALNLRSNKRNAPVIMSADNYDTVTVKVNEEKADLPTGVMTFAGAAGESISITQVSTKTGCNSIMRTTQRAKWQAALDKSTVYWYQTKCGIEFLHLKEHCDPDEVIVTYIPELTANSFVQDTRAWAIVNMVTIFLKSAKEGVIVDTSNDGNPNQNVQTEINRNVLKMLQGLR